MNSNDTNNGGIHDIGHNRSTSHVNTYKSLCERKVIDEMSDQQWLAEQFEASRNHLQAVAYRMLGSLNEAKDAVQESWIRLSRSNMSEVQNFDGWMTTVVSRVCLDMLRTRKARREQSIETAITEQVMDREAGGDPEYEALLADSVGLAHVTSLFS